MAFKLTNTAILGLSFYLCSLLQIFPYTFKKNNKGSLFLPSRFRLFVAIILSLPILLYTLISFNNYLFLIVPYIIFSIYFFTWFYSKNQILKCLNASYLLLRNIKRPQNIFGPMIFTFSPLILFIFSQVFLESIIDNEIKRTLVQLRFLLTLTIKYEICSLCYATSFILKDICRQLEDLLTIPVTKTSSKLRLLTHLHSQVYQLVGMISEAFGPFLLNFILVYTIWLLIFIASLPQKQLLSGPYFALLVDGWAMVVICASSQCMDSEESKLLLLIQKLMARDTSVNNYKMLAMMMEESRLRQLKISVKDCFNLDLPLLLTLANVMVTYLVIFLELL